MDAQKIALLEAGAFPNHFDPWIEKSRYFYNLHAQMISNILNAIQDSAIDLGYIVGIELSSQIAYIEPLLAFRDRPKIPTKERDYDVAVNSLGLDLGTEFLQAQPIELNRLFIKTLDVPRLVTVIEIIYPSAKSDEEKIALYHNQREKLLNSGVDVVELDLSRSSKRMINFDIAHSYPYHIAIHLFDSTSRFWGMNLQDPLKSFALPLEDKAIRIDLDKIYRQTYSETTIAYQMFTDEHYTIDNLPFPSTISDAERDKLMLALEVWKAKLQSI